MTSARVFTVRVLKRDGTEYRRWQANLRHREDPLLIFDAEFDVDVSHELLGEIQRGTRTVEYYWLNRWYNIFRFLDPDGSTRLWYCNVNMPPKLEDAILSYIDLDIDILVRPDLSYQVMDLDEFEANSNRFGYSADEKAHAHSAVDELVSMIQLAQFPFDSSSVSALVHA
jgi:uncharacterized protein